MAAGQHRHPGTGVRRQAQDGIGQSATGVTRHDDVRLLEGNSTEVAFNETHAVHQSRPCVDQRAMQRRGRRWNDPIDDERLRRGVVEQQHRLCEQAMPACQIDQATAPEVPAHTPRNLPRLVQFLARQALGVADGARQPIEQRVSGEPTEVEGGQS